MRAVPREDTAAEIRLQNALRHEHVGFETHLQIFGCRPDVVLRSSRIAVFVDGDFWHGRLLVERGMSMLETQFPQGVPSVLDCEDREKRGSGSSPDLPAAPTRLVRDPSLGARNSQRSRRRCFDRREARCREAAASAAFRWFLMLRAMIRASRTGTAFPICLAR